MRRLLLADRVKGRQDSFLAPLLPALSQVYDVHFIAAGPGQELAEAIRAADIVWLEWCWDHAVWATRSGVLAGKPCVLRLHSVEALQTDFPGNLDWTRVHRLITVGEDITEVLLARYPGIADTVPIEIVPNGINLKRFAAGDPDRFRVAWVGHLEPKKNPMLLLQVAYRLQQLDHRYRICIAGAFTDVRTKRYMQRMVPALGLSRMLQFDGVVHDMPAWYADKGVLLSTSMYESFGVNIGEAMAVGAFPVIHDFPGADRLWPSECLFAAVDEAVELIRLSRPSLYRDWVAEHYSLERQEAAVLLLLDRVVTEVAANSSHAAGKDGESAVHAAGCTVVEAEQTRGDVKALAHCDPATQLVAWRGARFRVIHHTAVADALASFQSDFEVGTLEFFDAVLPFCDRMIDIGAYAGLMSLYAANRVANVFAFEASPTNFSLLEQNIAANDELRERIRLYRFGLGNRDEMLPLYAKGAWDSGSSIFRTVERGALVNGVPEAMVQLRDANTVLRETGVTGHTLLKIDVEGAEYLVVPAIAALLAEVKPFLHLSFHPFNLVAGADDYVNTLTRIRRAMEIGEALAPYRFMYCRAQGQWVRIEWGDRMTFLREYLLRHKVVPRVGSPQYGFIDAIGFTDVKLPALDEPKPTTPPAPG